MTIVTQAMPVVVLTGGIASGKTAVSDLLAARGIPVVDTDLIAREVVAPGTPGLAAVENAFGSTILTPDGALDRKALGAKVFKDRAARKQLENILHPLIEETARERIAELPAAPYCVLVVPLLVESGLFKDADQVVVVDVPENLQRQRLQAREGLDPSSVGRMLAAQAGRKERLAVADRVIDNTGSLADLSRQVDHLHRELRSHFARIN
ncbi:MAG: dephospho-CoA kinase [Wenzhouxiangella sp.]|jgi:dephospho-CoA kinase|nr:dephospho-CoA kinase [Wenzhouxiangella sp.]